MTDQAGAVIPTPLGVFLSLFASSQNAQRGGASAPWPRRLAQSSAQARRASQQRPRCAQPSRWAFFR